MSGLFAGTSLEQPVTCEHCGKTLDDCACPCDAAGRVCRPQDQAVRVRREKRRGKWTTVAAHFDPVATDLDAMLKAYRGRFGCGGTTTDDGFELQGDHRDAVIEDLLGHGYAAKAAGG